MFLTELPLSFFLFHYCYIQSDYTLWRLKVFVKDALEDHEKASVDNAFYNNDISEDLKNISKRKREFCDAQVKTNMKKARKMSNL